jgi:hypothetical protein
MAFQRFNRQNDIVENQRTIISSGLWSGGSSTLTSFYTQSLNGNITGSFLDIYQEDPNLSGSAEVQFSLGYAHIAGSGSAGNTTKLTTGGRQSAALYRQFRNLLLPPNSTNIEFTAGSTEAKDDFYFISFQRARQREKIDPGNWQLHLKAGSDVVRLIDDSGASNNPTVNEGGRVFNIVSGSIANGVETAATSEGGDGAYGLFYPDLGIILLNARKLDDDTDITTARNTDAFDNNPQTLYNSIVEGASFQARREEEISSTNYFCRVNNRDFNFSTNPTYATQSDGSFTQPTFFKDPKTYITQVGLYNDANELLAIAKLSKPILKSYSREAIIKVKLDF